MVEEKGPFIFRLAALLVCLMIVGYLASVGQTILSPLFFAFLMSLLFVPLANFLEGKLRFSRMLSSAVSFIIMLAVLLSIILFFTIQLGSFVNDFPSFQEQIQTSVNRFQVWVSDTMHVDVSTQGEYIRSSINRMLSYSGVILGYTVTTLSSMGAFVVFSMIFFVFIMQFRSDLHRFIISVFHDRHREMVRDIIFEVQAIIKQYIVGLFIQIVIVSTLTSILLSVLGMPYALLLGVFTGFINVIPYVGIIVSGIITSILSLAMGVDGVVFIVIGYFIIHAIDANVVIPVVVGSKVRINALFTFTGLLIGEHLWGISGMFFSIPFMAILKVIFDKVESLNPWGRLLGGPREDRRYKVRTTTTTTIVEVDNVEDKHDANTENQAKKDLLD